MMDMSSFLKVSHFCLTTRSIKCLPARSFVSTLNIRNVVNSSIKFPYRNIYFIYCYRIVYIEEKVPDNFTIEELELFSHYLFHELLELVDFNLHAAGDASGCPQFHILPRFVRDLPDHGKEMLSMNQVLTYLIQQNVPVVDDTELGYQLKLPQVQF